MIICIFNIITFFIFYHIYYILPSFYNATEPEKNKFNKINKKYNNCIYKIMHNADKKNNYFGADYICDKIMIYRKGY